jgi:AraC-like DNA-binding protein
MLLYDWLLKILFLMQIVQMNTRLDRLSALLEGVAPVFSVIESIEQLGALDLTVPQLDPSLVMVINPLGDKHQAHPDQPTLPRPSLWIGHLSHWAALNAKQSANTRMRICIRAQLTGPLGSLLMEEFAQPTDLLTDTQETALSVPMALIQQEVSHPRCGQPALLKSAGDILFIGILRHLVANPNPDRLGLLHALSDVRIAKALVAMHQAPHFNWNLAALALEAGMSRTSFATAFKKAMDKTPGKYLLTLRLALARRALDSGKTVKEAARISGYRNPASIARAFKSNVTAKR